MFGKVKSNGKRFEIVGTIDNRYVLNFAQNNNLWIDDLYSLGVPFSSGNENTNVLNEGEGFVYKSNNLMNTQTITGLFEKVALHNQFFPDTKYEFVGFTGIDNGAEREPYIEVIFRQQLIDESELASKKEFETYFKMIGLEKINDSAFSANDCIISDLHSRNVLKDKNGELYIVDAELNCKQKERNIELHNWLSELESFKYANRNFINQQHRESTERKKRQIAEWRKQPVTLEFALQRQRKREQQAQTAYFE